MKQTQSSNAKTQTGSAPANETNILPVRRLQVSGRRLWPKAGIIAVLLGTGLLPAMGQTNQPQYRFIEITLPGPGFAVGVNDSGLVTGYYTDPVTGDWHSFLMQHGVLTTGISAPGATVTALGPANNLGVEGGNYGDETNQRPVFHDIRRGTYTPLPEIPDMPLNFGDGINDFGHASGVAYSGGTFDTGGSGLGMNWTWDGRNYSFFTVPGAVNGAFAGGINDLDQVTGYYVDSSGTPHGFLKDGSKYTTFDVPGALATLAYGINNLTVVTGLYLDASGNPHGYFWSRGQFVTVDATIPGAVGSLWYGSNDQGDLAGYFEDTSNVSHAVIALRVDKDFQDTQE
jgi:hypothetical protein